MEITADRPVREAHWGYRLRRWTRSLIPHLILIGYSLIALFPIYMIVMNSFKNRKAIFRAPFQLPNAETFSLIGYETVFGLTFKLFLNSIIVRFGPGVDP
jgi:raffinose/stachyose/melibiose transport system permease protein